MKHLLINHLRQEAVMHASSKVATAVLAGSLVACASALVSNPNLDLARRHYVDNAADPNTASLAALELQQAKDALDRASMAWRDREEAGKVDTLAHVAKQKIDIASEVAKRKVAERQVAEAGKQRDAMLLAQRTAEADKARLSADMAQARARQLENELRELAAKETERGTVVTLGNLMFSVDSAQINEGGMHNLRKVADVLIDHPQRTVMIEGFTDDRGSAEHNKQLSERRSAAIRTALINMGVGAGRISTRGYGEAYPVADNVSSVGRQLNRRVEIVISDDTGRISPRIAATSNPRRP
jgi:outer membrane protein OmpA-like peptidoglycan-associated protein